MELVFLAILIALMAGALASGFPVAFSLPGSAIITIALAATAGLVMEGDASAFFYQGGPSQWLNAGVTNFRGIYWEVERDTLIAIPLFIFMGIMLQRSKVAEDLLLTMAKLFGPLPGGLGISVILVGALLAATTGILGATVVAMGLISLPAMMRNNYSTSLASGTIAASGTLGQVIPPSIVLIILADQLASAVDQASTARKALYKATTGGTNMPSEFSLVSTSAGDMFLGAFVPGLVLVGLYVLYVFVIALLKPSLAPSVASEGTFDRQFLLKVFVALVPPLTLIFVVLGSILFGVATVNQAGAVGAIGAILMAGYRLFEERRGTYYPIFLAGLSLALIAYAISNYETNIKSENLSETGFQLAVAGVAGLLFAVAWSGWRTFRIDDTLRYVMMETAKTTCLVFIILLGAAMLTSAFRAFGGEELVRHFLTALSGGFWAQFTMVMLVIFVLGFFLDYIEIAVVVVPIVAPILLADPSANITAVWLGVMIGLNIQTSFLTPPFGFALFYLRGVAPKAVKTLDIYKGVIPFIALQLVGLAIVGLFPPLVNYLPSRVSMLSETAPPPINPRLQVCMEGKLFENFKSEKVTLLKEINKLSDLPLASLPENMRGEIVEMQANMNDVFSKIEAIGVEQKKYEAVAETHRSMHVSVRSIERDIRRVDGEVTELEEALNLAERQEGSPVPLLTEIRDQIASLGAERETLQASIPIAWSENLTTIRNAQKDLSDARRSYRRSVDQSYSVLTETIDSINQAEALKASSESLSTYTVEGDADERKAALKELSKSLQPVSSDKTVKRELKKLRKIIKNDDVDQAKLNESLEKIGTILDTETSWRVESSETLLPALVSFEEKVRLSIGLRQQERMPRDIALAVASCSATHRDISLNF